MLPSEKRSLIRFLVIYLTSTLLLFSLASYIYYTSSKHHLLDKQQEILKYEAQGLKSTLRTLHKSDDDILYYPYNSTIQTAIYTIDKRYIFGTLEGRTDYTYEAKDMLYYRTKIDPYYLGAAYAVLTKKINTAPIKALHKDILLFMLGASIFFLIVGYYLGRLFVAPMRESLDQINRFIQDTTHELNTPISTILANIELIESFGKHTENKQELKRIEIASKTLSCIYDDLTYLNLNHHYHRDVVEINLSKLLAERIVYFTTIAEAKHLNIDTEIHPNIILFIDNNDALRLIDNLLSNAIKYNKHHGALRIKLTQNFLHVEDTGIGMNQTDIAYIMQRFKRANSSEGGFGIGLHIINKICNDYTFSLYIDSKKNKGTKVKVQWLK